MTALYENDVTGTRIVEEQILVPDDSIVRYHVQPSLDDNRITIRVSLNNVRKQCFDKMKLKLVLLCIDNKCLYFTYLYM